MEGFTLADRAKLRTCPLELKMFHTQYVGFTLFAEDVINATSCENRAQAHKMMGLMKKQNKKSPKTKKKTAGGDNFVIN